MRCGLSKEHVCVSFAVNWNDLSVSKMGNLWNVSIKSISAVLKQYIVEDSVCVLIPYYSQKVSNKIHLDEQIRVISGCGKVRGYYSVVIINTYHSC